jgi:sugar phosphate isomerase/epimerase
LTALVLPARAAYELFAPTNLVAWCIVPFDTQKRGPEERAAMLQRLGVSRLAYDWRAEHIPTFDAEVAALAKRKIELRAWWFPAELNADAKAILDVLRRHKLHPELWIMLVDPAPNGDQTAKVEAAAQQLKPVAAAADELGAKLGLYNHGGWFGEPENQLQVKARLAELGSSNVGLVYNLHHGHAHLDRLPALLKTLAPHLLCLNLNGMVRNGDQVGKKIVPFGQGDDDLAILLAVRDSGYHGPIGVLGHTEEDAELKLAKDLGGLKQVAARFAAESKSTAGTPKISGRDASQQSEADWVDSRWQQTDVGPFLASNLPLPEGTIAKALSIKVGEGDAGTVAYDMSNGSLRAAWTGGFLQFNPGRFGLIGAPKPAGTIAFTALPDAAWPGHEFRFGGIHRGHGRIVLESRVNGHRVLESPWLEQTPAGPVFTRTFWIDAHSEPLNLLAAAHLKGTNIASRGFHTRSADGKSEHRSITDNRSGDVVSAMAVSGVNVSAKANHISAKGGSTELTLAPSSSPQVFTLRLWRGDTAQFGAFTNWIATAKEPVDFGAFMEPSASRWQELETVGARSPDTDILAVDTITLPYDNPWNALMLAAGVDFGPKGEGYLCTIHGDVWRVTGIDESLKRLRWKRYATGLFQALGLKVVDGKVLVLGRDRITRLHDENGDGEADFYESFFDGIATSTGGHDYVTCLETDAAGNLYYVDPKGVHRVSPDGRTQTTLATGWRNPNGMGVRADGLVTVAPQQGEWTPSSQISEVREGGYYGYAGPKVAPARPLGYDAPLCWIPHRIDNSSGSQVWLPARRPGVQPGQSDAPRLEDSPLAGQMLHLLWGRCGMMLVLRDASGRVPQGAVVPLPAKFLSGPNRASFNPRDGALYVAGSTGWQTSAARDGALQRVRWTGRKAYLPTAWHAQHNGLSITFSQPLDRSTAEDVGSYAVKRWNYRYAAQYGSKDWSVTNPDQEGRDDVPVKSAKLQPDGHTVVLDLGPLSSVMQMEVQWNLDAADGHRFRSQLWLTVNSVP